MKSICYRGYLNIFEIVKNFFLIKIVLPLILSSLEEMHNVFSRTFTVMIFIRL